MNIALMQTYMKEHELDAVLAMDPITTAYLRRFWQGSHLRTLRFDDHPCFPVFLLNGDAFVVDYMSWAPPDEILPAWFKQYYRGRGSGLDGAAMNTDVLAKALQEHDLSTGRIGLDLDDAPYGTVRYLKDKLPQADFVNAQTLFSRLRAVKEPWQIEIQRKAIAILEEAYLETLQQVKEGVTVRYLARFLTSKLHRDGMIMTWCSPLDIASKWFPTQPYELDLYMSEDEWQIKKNDAVEIFWDMGGEYHGYVADMNRAFYLGTAPQEMVEKYEQYARWQAVAAATIKLGMSVPEAYEALHEAVLDEFGRVWGFLHGVGLFAHEDPYLDLGVPLERLMTERNDVSFEVGTVVALEPFPHIDPSDPTGIKGEGGGCIEDEWLMTPEGFKRMGSLPQKLFVL